MATAAAAAGLETNVEVTADSDDGLGFIASCWASSAACTEDAAIPRSIGLAPSSILAIKSNFSDIDRSSLLLIESFRDLTSCPVDVIGPSTSKSLPHCKQNFAVASFGPSHLGQ